MSEQSEQWLYDTGEAFAAYQKATANEAELRQQANQQSKQRDQAVADLHALGYSYRQLAERLGVSHSRVQQMIQRHNAR